MIYMPGKGVESECWKSKVMMGEGEGVAHSGINRSVKSGGLHLVSAVILKKKILSFLLPPQYYLLGFTSLFFPISLNFM